MIEPIIVLVSELLPIVVKAINARAEEHTQIMADAKAAVDKFTSTIGGLTVQLAQDDADIDSKITSTFKAVP